MQGTEDVSCDSCIICYQVKGIFCFHYCKKSGRNSTVYVCCGIFYIVRQRNSSFVCLIAGDWAAYPIIITVQGE
nr:MAG TPA: hypothetical protein [Caudoviricetes sp.]